MTERKPCSYANRSLPLMHQLPSGIVNRHNMVSIHPMAQSQNESSYAQSEEQRRGPAEDDRADETEQSRDRQNHIQAKNARLLLASKSQPRTDWSGIFGQGYESR